MRNVYLKVILFFNLSLMILLSGCNASGEGEQSSINDDVNVNVGINNNNNNHNKPNIIYIMADDMGYGDLGVYGQDKIKTPNIDKLAGDGMRFTQHYAGATVCGPSRASLLTGLHGGHSPIRGNPGWTNSGGVVDLKPTDITIAQMLKTNGYKTAVIGKWGLAESKETETKEAGEGDWLSAMPLQQGFDYFFGLKGHLAAHYYYWHRLFENNTPFELKDNDHMNNKGIYTHDLFTEKAIDYVKEQSSEQPFFLYLAYTIPHLALTVPNDSKEQYLDLGWPKRMMNTQGHYRNDPEGNTTYAGMVSRMDNDIGKLMEALKQQGLDENTLVIFTSDNGHEYDKGFFNSNGPLKGSKRDLYEGGIRIPFIAKWPGKIKANTSSDHISAFWDMMPTFCDLAGAKNCPVTDGISISNTLLGQNEQQQHEYLYWEFNESRGPLQALRNDNWKLVKRYNKPIELYDLSKDIGELNNLAADYPEVVKVLLAKVDSARTYHPEFTLKKLVSPYKKMAEEKKAKIR
ncbi:arylsulfatase [Colwellia sp. 12G3]|uniref:arylsulfatase n=1 Tax=Colwellia sp. 12G3 TaxID=2058299 RepID=UPI000C334D36|nr:arylsulfatase [Colwellia sp. 12G3]PKI16670.1 arylsulfatase [Colwellia sp. 12G3]